VLLAGAITSRVWVKMLVTPCVPFCVSLFGAYAAYWVPSPNSRKPLESGSYAPQDAANWS
jgi:hypothetical protein